MTDEEAIRRSREIISNWQCTHGQSPRNVFKQLEDHISQALKIAAREGEGEDERISRS